MIEARYEHFQPETGILLGEVEIHKVIIILGKHNICEYLVNHCHRTEPNEEGEISSVRFSKREDAQKRFNELLMSFNSEFVKS